MATRSWLRFLNLPSGRRGAQARAHPQQKSRSRRPFLESLEDRITPTAQPFSFLAPGLTQELVATLSPSANSGYAFDSQGNPYTIDFGTNHLYKVDLSTTNMVHGSPIHPLIDLGFIHFPSG